MKYVLMFVDTEQFASRPGRDGRTRTRTRLRPGPPWFAEHNDKITAIPPDAAGQATTVRLDRRRAADHRRPVRGGQGGRQRLRRDRRRRPGRGPAAGQSWPACPVVEIRPIAGMTPTLPRRVGPRGPRPRGPARRVAGALVGDFAAAEDLVQDAIEAALPTGRSKASRSGPTRWLYTVARRRGLDLLRRESRYRDKLALVPWPAEPEPDDRLRLIFTCCHPALPRTAQVALTLRVVCGLTTAQIAKAFLVPETTVGQRITRAKRKIGERASRTGSPTPTNSAADSPRSSP